MKLQRRKNFIIKVFSQISFTHKVYSTRLYAYLFRMFSLTTSSLSFSATRCRTIKSNANMATNTETSQATYCYFPNVIILTIMNLLHKIIDSKWVLRSLAKPHTSRCFWWMTCFSETIRWNKSVNLMLNFHLSHWLK